MVVRESHFQGLFEDKHIISVDRYIEGHGLDIRYCFEIRGQGPVPTAEEVEKARLEAFIQERDCHHVVITYSDARVVPENNRNAPLDGNATSTEKDDWGFLKCPKKRVSLDGDQFYDWKPLTKKDEFELRKKVKHLKVKKRK